ncbi:MAG: Crp/Fnr family transcriptional regulator [Bacteroidetes bacterium]|nr:Crp/Fnr family transcriptional regulator [Bacteroidota bacterium]
MTNKPRNTCMNCNLKCHSLFKHLSHQELEKLNKGRRSIVYKKGENIYKENTDPTDLLCLNTGKVKIIKQVDQNTEQIIGLKGPVDFLGFQELMSDDAYRTSAVALETCKICWINKKDFIEVIENNSQFALKIISYQAELLEFNNKRVISLTQKHMLARLADVLLELVDLFGYDKLTGSLNIKLKRKELASLSNMTTANAIRSLAELAKNNIIKIEGREILIADLYQLQEASIMKKN